MAETKSSEDQLKSIQAIVNGEIHSKLLTNNNFKVLEVKATPAARTHNCEALVEIDLYADQPNTQLSTSTRDRYVRRTVRFSRANLYGALLNAGIARNKDGSFVIPSLAGQTAEAALESIKDVVNIDIKEVTAKLVGQKLTLIAKRDSLGFVGSVTITAVADAVEEPEATDEPTPEPQA